MKKYIFSLAMFILSIVMVQAQNDVISKYFKKYMNEENVTSIRITSNAFHLFSDVDFDTDDKDAQLIVELLKGAEGLHIFASGDNNKELYKKAKKVIKKENFEVLVSVRDKEHTKVDLLLKQKGNSKELLLLVGDEEDFFLLSFIGKIDVDKMTNRAK